MIPQDGHLDQEVILGSQAMAVGMFRQRSEEEEARENLAEMIFLAQTLSISVVEEYCAQVREIVAATVLSPGKIAIIKEILREKHISLLLFDGEISPAQQRNLEKALSVCVMDRTEIILAVFAERARTKEARLQIECAQLTYLAPRLKRMWSHLSRQHVGGSGGGGGGYLRGTGETQIEIDRRLLNKRLEWVRKELHEVVHVRKIQRCQRERTDIPTFAIIGYTNAGKSTLMNLLTAADVFVENKLFATLDTTTRQCILPNKHQVLLTDTVGFIRKLPHLLVSAFKSTLEESLEADILIHLIDASHPRALEQATTTFDVLSELNVTGRPMVTVCNKCDLNTPMLAELLALYPGAVCLSAHSGMGLSRLQDVMMEMTAPWRKSCRVRIPQRDYAVIAQVLAEGVVRERFYEDNDVFMDVEVPLPCYRNLKPYLQE